MMSSLQPLMMGTWTKFVQTSAHAYTIIVFVRGRLSA